VRSIPFPAELILSGLEALSEGVSAADLSRRQRARLGLLFDRYRRRLGRGDRVRPAAAFNVEPLSLALEAAYRKTYKGRKLFALREALLALVGNRCPSCGGSRPTHLDHHLPQSRYAEYAIFPLNLVGNCGDCNTRKSDRPVETAEDAFIHPYLDVLPPVAFLKFSIELTDSAIIATVGFDQDAPIEDEQLKTRIRLQLERIVINTLLKGEIAEFLTEKANVITDAFGEPSPQAVEDFLLRSAASADMTYGRSSWQSALLRALAGDPVYCASGHSIPRRVLLETA
jgi:hypothetical protein